MRVDFEKAKPAGVELVTTNLASLTVLLTAVVFLGAVCKFLRRCWKKVAGRGQRQKHDVIAFEPIRTLPRQQKSLSTSKLNRGPYAAVPQDDRIPFDEEHVPVQPELRLPGSEIAPLRPRAPTDPGCPAPVARQISLPVSLSKHRGSIRGWSSHTDIMPSHLDPKLYKKQASLHSMKATRKNKCAMLDTEVYFDTKSLNLEVKVNSIQQLISKEHVLATNTYVTVKKIPDNEVRRTSVHNQAIDPVFNDDFTFKVSPNDDVSSHVLFYDLYHMDRLSTSSLRGEARLPLFQIDFSSRQRLLIPFIDSRRSFLTAFHPAYRAAIAGHILVSLRFQPWKDTIVVNPICVCNILKKRHGTYGKDVYVKIVLRHRGTRLLKVKTEPTEMERMAHSPYYQATFNEPISLDIKSAPVEECDITVSLNRYLFLKSSFIIGQVRLSVNEPDYEAIHYQSMIDTPGEHISVWYEMRGFSTNPVADDSDK